ncbi:putative ABC transporter ATP-binding protein [Thermogemmatispora aurantia]|jgi:putative ABC transport system ATP-binding protein|uniref:Putative ABC transporter ATP-binding protein n=1 Tax=Thermogemmatispora aurantia TaxID=2045279 RepID=A0A5J4K9V8_9CHLR|nr:ABC transporter ATP-binding protein [Thermogemmatispora aurantia]GER82916.1 putative ABC transporter ATP-binding protein [Thermogemmatispora aurantia]
MTIQPEVPRSHPQATERAVILDVQEITKTLPLSHEELAILKGISFQIYKSEIVAIVGPSGAGKSTLLGIIAGLDSPSAGRVLLNGMDISHLRESQLASVRNRSLGMVFQAFNLIPTLTAQENVELPLYTGKHRGSPATRARELLTLVGLEQRLHHRPNQLSGGEQQRVALARALACDPALIIADEPTGNLDARNSEHVLQLILQLRSTIGKTFIIATHDPLVASLADRTIRIVDGQIAAIEATHSVVTQ